FGRLQTARSVQRYFFAHQLRIPRLEQTGLQAGKVIWVRPTYQMIHHVLTNPAYAGLFVYGRRVQQAQPGDPPQLRSHRRRREQMTYAEAGCQYFPISYLDPAVRDAFFAAIQPSHLQVLLGALDALERQRQALYHQWQLKLERARYAAGLAERQYDACDPDNRLLAGALEQRWNDALAGLQ